MGRRAGAGNGGEGSKAGMLGLFLTVISGTGATAAAATPAAENVPLLLKGSSKCVGKECATLPKKKRKRSTHGLSGGKPCMCGPCARKYNNEGSSNAPQLVDVKSKRCSGPICATKPFNERTQPTFGPAGGSRNDAVVCGKCAKDLNEKAPSDGVKMVDVAHPRCNGPLCSKKPKEERAHRTCGPIGGLPKDAVMCGKCAKELNEKAPSDGVKMVDVVNKRCKGPLCSTKPKEERAQPTCGPAGGSRIVCGPCAGELNKQASSDGVKLVDVANKRCNGPLCSKKPVEERGRRTYGPSGGKDAIVCGKCAKDLNEKAPVDGVKLVDVVSKRCNGPLCSDKPIEERAQPYFGPSGGSLKDAIMCCECAKEVNKQASGDGVKMVDVVNKRCKGPLCSTKPKEERTRPNFGPAGGSPNDAIMCGPCASEMTKPGQPRMVDLINPRCVSCKFTHGIKHYTGMCAPCFANTHPGAKMKRNLKVKERAMHKVLVAWLQSIAKFAYLELVYNKMVRSGDYPDWRIDCGTHVVGAECDESEHRNETTDCRERRHWRIFEALGERPIVFIRFNPDAYTDSTGKRHPSCFGLDGNGIQVLRDEVEWARRMDAVCAEIKKAIELVPGPETPHVQPVYMFYSAGEARPAPIPYDAIYRKIKKARHA
jgi:hypothetical protein